MINKNLRKKWKKYKNYNKQALVKKFLGFVNIVNIWTGHKCTNMLYDTFSRKRKKHVLLKYLWNNVNRQLCWIFACRVSQKNIW